MEPRTIQLTQAELGQGSSGDEDFDLDPRGDADVVSQNYGGAMDYDFFDLSSDRLPTDFRLDPDSLEALMTSVCGS
jgi:hypothetical protein